MSSYSSSLFPLRWCLLRLRRAALLILTISAILLISCAVFAFLNRGGAANAAKRLMNAASAVGGASNAKEARPGRAMVQYYPDNQDKYLFRKDNIRWDAEAPPPKTLLAEKQRQKLKDALEVEQNEMNELSDAPQPFKLVHIFYYTWYGAPPTDASYSHWNHKYLTNWNKQDRKRYPTGQHDPDRGDIASNFFPALGAYSSRDPKVISSHMRQIRSSGAGVLILSWYPPGLADENGLPSDDTVMPVMEAAHAQGLKLCILVEPYEGLNATNFRKNLEYASLKYVSHPAYYKHRVGRRELPVFYLYDSYRVRPEEWQRVFSRKGDLSVRDGPLDGLFLGLVAELQHRASVKRSKMDGIFTYFAANGFTHGSSWKNWKSLSDFCKRNSLLFSPSVGPGYIDTRVRPWNGQNTRDRLKGNYYDMAWRTAVASSPDMISLTSFNEWHEGTQLEEAVSASEKGEGGFVYLDYAPGEPDFYLRRTAEWVSKFRERKQQDEEK